MATTGQSHSTDRHLSDREFEELLQRTWELVQSQKPQKVSRTYEATTESPSWT
jgi:hypothetical protein